jgi:hypothetical protein
MDMRMVNKGGSVRVPLARLAGELGWSSALGAMILVLTDGVLSRQRKRKWYA